MYTIEHNSIGNDIRVSEKRLGEETPEHYAARILARREYGKAGEVWHINVTAWTEDGSITEAEAFIGRPSSDGNGTSGHNVFLVVTRD